MIKNKPLVSVIVPIFNQEKYLEKCLTSIIEQTYSHLEILLINDGSTDNSGKICEKFSKIDYRICIVEKENGGLVSARKKGVYLAKGEYVYFVDADDWIDKNVIEKLWLGGMHKGIDMIGLAGMWKEYRDKTHVKIDLAKLSGIFSTTELEDNHFQWISTDRFYNENVSFSLSMYAIKRKLILPNQMKVDDRIKIGEDFACVWPCLLQAETIAFIKSYGYHYRQTMSSMTQKCKKKERKRIRLWYEMCQRECASNPAYQDVLMKQLDFYTFYRLMLSDFSAFVTGKEDLFPFYNVPMSDKIVIYGAGILGKQIMGAIQNHVCCRVMLWVDERYKMYRREGLKVSSPQKLKQLEFDHILVAVVNKELSLIIKSILQEKYQIPEEKVAIININELQHNTLLKALETVTIEG